MEFHTWFLLAEEHRVLMSQIGGGEVMRHLIALLSSSVEKVGCFSLVLVCGAEGLLLTG